MNDQYQHFIKTTKQELIDKNKELHELYIEANKLYKVIKKNESYLQFIGFSINKLEDLNDRHNLVYYDIKSRNFDEKPEILRLKANINAYSNILVNKIPRLQKEIEVLTMLASAPFGAFMDLYIALNTSISEVILRGKEYTFPKKVGSLQVFKFKRDFRKKAVDYGESMKLKAKGVKKYIVYHLDDFYAGAKYVKDTAKVPNYKYYSFKFTNFINGKIRNKDEYYKTVDTEEDIINDNNLGNLDKMLMLYKKSNYQIYRDYV